MDASSLSRTSSSESFVRPSSPTPNGSAADSSSTIAAPSSAALNLAILLGKDRKQNSACDACRIRKVKCVRNEDDATCTFCLTKNVECTRYYMALATEASSKRAAVSKKRKRQATNGDNNCEVSARPELRVRTRTSNTDLTEGCLVQVRGHEKGVSWEASPHRICRIVYRPVAVVLDDENASPIAIDHVRPFEQQRTASPVSSMPSTPALVNDGFSFSPATSSPVTPLTGLSSPAGAHYFTDSFAKPSQPPSNNNTYYVPPHAYAQEWAEPSYVTYSGPAQTAHQQAQSVPQHAQSMVYGQYMSQNYAYGSQPQGLGFYTPSAPVDDAQLAYYRQELQPAATHFHIKPEVYV